MEALKAYLNQPDLRERQLEELKEFCRIPSVSGHGEQPAITAAARWVVARMEKAGIKTQVIPVENGCPVIYGEVQGRSEKTLLFYNHYDVQPPEPLELWDSDPFEPTERDGFLFARGIADNKGSLLSRIHAIEAYKAVHGELPFRVKFLVEGEEESGSKNLDRVVQSHQELFKADVAIWENARKDDHGRPTAQLGNKGMVKIELKLRVSRTDFHSGFAPIYPNAIWRMTQALSTLKDRSGKILVKGFFDRVPPFTDADAELCRKVPANVEEHLARMEITELVPGNDPYTVNRAMFYEPTINIQGIAGGHVGPGVKTIVPATAVARIDCRLVMDQDPDEIFEKVKAHLAAEGFGEIEVSVFGRSWPRRTPVDHPFVKLVAEAATEAYDKELVLLPTSGGTSPQYVFRYLPGLPVVNLGVSHIDCRQHAPNENIRIRDYYEGMVHIAAVIDRWGRS